MDESGFYVSPAAVRTTYVPVGETPVLREHSRRDHLCWAINEITEEGKLYMHEPDGPLKGTDVGFRFLKHLLRTSS